MEVIVQSVHFSAREELKDFVTEKLNGLEHFYDRVVRADVTFKLENTGIENKMCEIRLLVPGNDLFAKKQSDSFEKAATAAVAALNEQIKKLKDKVRG